MDQETIYGLSPGIRKLVVWLDSLGYATTDSGDGSNYEAGMEGAIPEPMVAITTTPARMIADADRLVSNLKDIGINMKRLGGSTGSETAPSIQASYDPVEMTSIIILLNVTDEMCDFSKLMTLSLKSPDHHKGSRGSRA